MTSPLLTVLTLVEREPKENYHQVAWGTGPGTWGERTA